MENTIMPGDRLIGNRLAFLKDTPERGDVVIFHYPDDEEELYVKSDRTAGGGSPH